MSGLVATQGLMFQFELCAWMVCLAGFWTGAMYLVKLWDSKLWNSNTYVKEYPNIYVKECPNIYVKEYQNIYVKEYPNIYVKEYPNIICEHVALLLRDNEIIAAVIFSG